MAHSGRSSEPTRLGECEPPPQMAHSKRSGTPRRQLEPVVGSRSPTAGSMPFPRSRGAKAPQAVKPRPGEALVRRALGCPSQRRREEHPQRTKGCSFRFVAHRSAGGTEERCATGEANGRPDSASCWSLAEKPISKPRCGRSRAAPCGPGANATHGCPGHARNSACPRDVGGRSPEVGEVEPLPPLPPALRTSSRVRPQDVGASRPRSAARTAGPK